MSSPLVQLLKSWHKTSSGIPARYRPEECGRVDEPVALPSPGTPASRPLQKNLALSLFATKIPAMRMAPTASSPLTIAIGGVRKELPSPASVYGAASRAAPDLPAGCSPAAKDAEHPQRGPRPSQCKYKERMISKITIYDALAGVDENGKAHLKCANEWDDHGVARKCFHQLHGSDLSIAYQTVLASRASFLCETTGCKQRAQITYDKLAVPCRPGGCSTTEYTNTVQFQVQSRCSH